MTHVKKKILVVDDEPDILDFMTDFLQDNNFEVVTATNGREGLEKAVETKPDLITLDISMPEESGIKAYRKLHENAETKDIPVIIITGVTKDFERFISTRNQVPAPIEYMEKPIDQDDFLAKINKILDAAETTV